MLKVGDLVLTPGARSLPSQPALAHQRRSAIFTFDTTAHAPFRPASSPAEAILRIHTLTATPPSTRGEKRALVALSAAMGLYAEMTVTTARLGEVIASAFDIPWTPGLHTSKNTVTLDGLNHLLEAATAARRIGALRPLPPKPTATLDGPEWAAFQPAISKIEAVTRIAALTGAPRETLGPGSKERKSVLTNLADRLLPGATLDRSSKTRLARSLAKALQVGWSDECSSTGETISLLGLNTILAGAERHLGRLGSSLASSMITDAAAEGDALAAALASEIRRWPWDGRTAVGWLRSNGLRGANDNEWQGFYFEAQAVLTLEKLFPPPAVLPRARFGATTFDYTLYRAWDLKAHTALQSFPSAGRQSREPSTVVLNDQEAIRASVAEQGLGFLIMSGTAVMDEDGSFVEWHREQKALAGVKTVRSNSGRSRMRKAAFVPTLIECFWIPDTSALDAAIDAGAIKHQTQGRQAPAGGATTGRERRPKYSMNLTVARKRLLVSSHSV